MKMASDEVAAEKDAVILYDLTVQAEWRQDPEPWNRSGKEKQAAPIKGTSNQGSAWSLLQTVGFVGSSAPIGSLPADLVRLINYQIAWKLAITHDGQLLAVVQDSFVEIRSSQNEFTTVAMRWQLPSRDPYPNWRSLAWSWNNSMLAISNSSGQVDIYDAILGSQVCAIPLAATQKRVTSLDLSQAISGLIFRDLKNVVISKDQHWFAELLVVTYEGHLVSYLVSLEGDYQQSHTFSFADQYPSGVFSMVFDPHHSTLLVGGCAELFDRSERDEAARHGITVWRILSDAPHYKLVSDHDLDSYARLTKSRRWRAGRWLSWSSETVDGIYKLSLSPDGKLAASVHFSGLLRIWNVPSLTVKHSWQLDAQPDFNAVNREVAENPKRRKTLKESLEAFFLTDISWWSNEAVILVRGTGSVTVSSVGTLQNLLGSDPEWFVPAPSVTSIAEGSFLGLECESKISAQKRHMSTSDGDTAAATDDRFEDSEDELEMTVAMKASRFVKQGLYYVTDSEKFRPPRKRPKHISRTYRLIGVKSTTPEELYARKIDSEEYGEALQLARTYQLDCDLVYQRQWRRTRVSVASIQDYLSKIIKRSWVLHECLERVPEDFDAMNELLKYGLRGTDLEAMVAIGQKQDGGRFILCEPDEVYESLDTAHDDSAAEAYELHQQRRQELLKQIDFDSLTLEQQELCRVRLKLLQFQDRLHTYEEILGGMHIAAEKYDHKFFERFRSENIVQLAIEYARAGDADALNCILTYHGNETLEHRLVILSNFPEICSPKEYADLLPKVSHLHDERFIVPLLTESWRQPDWCEQFARGSLLNTAQQDSGSFLYEEKPDWIRFRGAELSVEQATEWYVIRACEIERLSGLVDDALELIRLAMERNIEGLELLYDDLQMMEMLVYDCHVEECLTFDEYRAMPAIDRLRLLMSKTSEEMFDKAVMKFLVPFLRMCDKHEPGSYYRLLREYLVTMARNDLTLCKHVFRLSRQDVSERVIHSSNELMSIALNCVYALQADDQLATAYEILECLPEKEISPADELALSLHQQVDALEKHLKAAEIMQSRGLPQPVFYFRDTQDSVEDATKLLTRITRIETRKQPPLSERQLQKVLTDVYELRGSVYRCIDKATCHSIFVESLLCSSYLGNIKLAGRMLECSRGSSLATAAQQIKDSRESSIEGRTDVFKRKVPYDHAVELVLCAAREYFDASATMDDPDMELARACLDLITDQNASIVEERDLIEGLKLLYGLGVSMLPVQVRTCVDRIHLIKMAIDARTTTYKNFQRLLNLGRLLRVASGSTTEMHGKILRLVSHAALKHSDYKTAYEACLRLMDASYGPVWTECKILAEAVEFHDLSAKIDLLSFAVIHCAPSMIDSILNAKSLLQMQNLCERVSAQMTPTRESPNAGSVEPAPGAPLSARGAIAHTRDILSSTNRATRTALSHMTDAGWWKKTLGGLRPARRESDAEDDQNAGLSQLGFHPFFASALGNCYVNKGEADYFGQCPPKTEFAGLTTSECILRAAKMEDMITEGKTFSDQTTTEVLLRLAEDAITKDCTLGLGYLLALPNPLDADRCFDKLPQTDVTLRLAVYHYALQIAGHLRCGLDYDFSRDSLGEIYRLPPGELTTTLVTYVGRALERAEMPAQFSASVYQMALRLMHYNGRLTEYVQAQALQRLDRGIDICRFVVDDQYKKETILGLAMCTENDVYTIAVLLARTYKVPPWDVYMAHLEYLFDDSGLSTEQIDERVRELGFLPELVGNTESSSATAEESAAIRAKFAERMRLGVYPSIDGRDHARLLYYYSLLGDCDTAEKITPPTHARLLKKIKTTAPGLDYKLLTDGCHNPLDVLEPVLNQDNVVAIAKLAVHIHDQNGESLQAGSIYRIWCTKMFFEGQPSKKTADNPNEWLHRYEACGDHVAKMSADDFLTFVHSLTFVPRVVTEMPVDCRRQILRRALKYSRQQQSAKKKTADAPSASSKSWDEVTQQLQQSLDHLDKLGWPIVAELKDSDDPKLQEYATRFDLSRSETDKLERLLVEIIIDAQNLEIVDGLRKALPSNDCTVLMLLKDALALITTSLENPGNADPLFEGRNALEVLREVCSCVAKLQESGSQLACAKDAVRFLEPFCADASVDAAVRISVMQIIDETIKLKEDESSVFILHRTQAIVSSMAIDVQVTVDDVRSREARLALFDRLLAVSTDSRQLITVSELLLTWPSMSDKNTDNAASGPWCRLCDRLVQTGSDAAVVQILHVVTELQKADELSCQCTKLIAASLLSHAPPHRLAAVKCLLIGSYAELYDDAVETLKLVDKLDDDEDLFILVLKRHLVPNIVDTVLYPRLVDYVLTNQEADATSVPYHLQIETIVNQLLEAGHQVEAGSLLMKHRATHRGLRTFDAAFSIISRLFTGSSSSRPVHKV